MACSHAQHGNSNTPCSPLLTLAPLPLVQVGATHEGRAAQSLSARLGDSSSPPLQIIQPPVRPVRREQQVPAAATPRHDAPQPAAHGSGTGHAVAAAEPQQAVPSPSLLLMSTAARRPERQQRSRSPHKPWKGRGSRQAGKTAQQRRAEMTTEEKEKGKTHRLQEARAKALKSLEEERSFEATVWRAGPGGVYASETWGLNGFVPLTSLNYRHSQRVLSEEARLLAEVGRAEPLDVTQKRELRKKAMSVLVGERLQVRVIHVPAEEEMRAKKVVFSERAAAAVPDSGGATQLTPEQLAAVQAVLASEVECLVLRVASFGVLVEFECGMAEPVLGLISARQLSWSVARPAELVQVGVLGCGWCAACC